MCCFRRSSSGSDFYRRFHSSPDSFQEVLIGNLPMQEQAENSKHRLWLKAEVSKYFMATGGVQLACSAV